MGMTLDLAAISAEQLDQFLANPASITRYATALGSVLSKPGTAQPLGLEKTWHGLHYTLTGSAEMGEPPLNFIVAGGQPIGADAGYGPIRALSPRDVQELDSALQQVTEQDFIAKFDPAAMAEAGVYPDIWDEEVADLQEEYLDAFRELKSYLHQAAGHGNAVLLII